KGFFTTPTHNVAGVSMLQIGWQEEAGVMGRIVNGMIPLRDHHLVMLIDGVAGITPLWQVERPESDDHLICYDGSFVYLLDSRDQRYDILRGSDGLFLKSQSLPRHDEIRGLFGSIAVLWDRIDQVSGRLVGYNLSNHEILWSIEVTGSVTMTAIDDRHLALFDAGKNQILFIDPTQTTPVLFEVSAPRTTARDLYIEQDPIHWYVHITQKPAQSIPQNLGLEAGEDINGPILAISKATRKVAWSTEVEALRWIPGQMSSLPFLMYGAKQRTTRPDENGEQSFLTKSQMLLIDKRTGQQILSLPDQITGTLMQFTPDLEKQEYRWDFESGSLTVTGEPE
ncbi:MAG: hypothetical protein KDA78_20245, partial [Planctomycetaceae bacterium]|nr:hypothetical protein [Planctomycetaceae bacterium]